ncbi:MAG: glycosyltransferase family 4 protein [Chitinispirillaceae bacterium]|nr:glycosyltransferase family 4 protein [Chitinispirillaceae bacterium]
MDPSNYRHVIVYEFIPPSDGGIAQMAWGILAELNRRGLKTALCGFGDLLRHPMYREVTSDLWPLPRKGWKSFKDVYCLVLGIRLFLRYGRSAVIYSLTWKSGRMFSLLSRMAGWHYVVFAIGNEVTRQLGKRKERRMRRVFQRAHAVIALSTYVRERIRPLGLQNVAVINPGVDVSLYRKLDRKECKRRFGWEGRTVVLTLARIVPRKGQDTVIRSIKDLRSAVPDVVYVIAGTGEEAEIARLKKLAQDLGVEQHIHFAGFAAAQDKPAIYNASDIYVMVSRYEKNEKDVEGFGITFLEAGACGIPVIGGNSGGIPDAIEDGVSGYLVDTHDHTELSRRLALLLTDTNLWKTMSTKARQRISDSFTWEKYVDRMVHCCTQAVAAGEC